MQLVLLDLIGADPTIEPIDMEITFEKISVCLVFISCCFTIKINKFLIYKKPKREIIQSLITIIHFVKDLKPL